MNQYALLSLTDKRGADEFATGLVQRGYLLLSTGGTASALRNAGLTVKDVSEHTGFPEMLEGRVKTLHPLIHGGLLGDTRKQHHLAQMQEAGIEPISILAVNLYQFEETISKPHSVEEAIESIDIGGPAMIRAAAKNNANVAVITDPADYPRVLAAIDDGTLPSLQLELAAKAYRHTAYYDSVISRYLSQLVGVNPLETETHTLGLRRIQQFRYGENPHQEGSLYRDPLAERFHQSGIAQATMLWGKELSYNNLADADAALELVADLAPGSCAIIKHANPCGVASMESPAESYRQARASDPVSAFGGIAAFNCVVDEDAALAMAEKGNFLEVIIASAFTPEALSVFRDRAGWGKDVRLLESPIPGAELGLSYRSLRGGMIIQQTDEEPASDWTVATLKQPSEEEMEALRFAWKVVKHVRSNAIVVTGPRRMFGVGAGQMNRVQSVRLALDQAGDHAPGAVLASDAFFPFPDSIKVAAAAGITAVVQPGGSKKDGEVIAAANELGLAMVLTGFRHFRH